MKKIITILILSSLVAPSLPVYAAEFNANNIISDYELEETDSLSQDAIQRFLESKGSWLAKYTEVVSGARKTAGQIIYEEARRYEISPKFILAMLQKEQSLITDASPSQDQLDWATGFGVCDSCSKSDPALTQFKGFYKQVSLLAEKVRVNYLRDLIALGKTFTGWGPYLTKQTLDGFEVTPVNNATAVLYTYNPYRGGTGIGANFNFWRIWNRYFTRGYPDGTLLQQSGESGVWLIQNNKRRPFLSRAALVSRYSPGNIIQVSKNELEAYEAGAPIKFANYSLLRLPTGAVYLLVDDSVRGIVSREVFRTIGFNPEEIINVTEADLAEYARGPNITMASAHPTGALLQNKQTGAVYYVRDGVKQGIIDRSIMKINFPNQKPTPVHGNELDQYEDGGRLTLSDGTIVTSPGSPAVYVISRGARRPVISGEAFAKLGYKWENVITVPQKVADLHPIGEVLDTVDADGEGEVEGENRL